MSDFSILRKITPIQICGIKNQGIWIRICGEIDTWNEKRNLIAKSDKNKLNLKLTLFMAIHSTISKTKIGVQDVISPYSLDQFLISNPPRTRKRVKKLKKLKDS